MDDGDLVPDEVIIGVILERARGDEARRRLPARRLPAHDRAGRGARRGAGGARPQAHRGAAIDVPDEEIVARLSGRRVCSKSGHVYHVDFDPPKHDGRLRRDGSQAHPARRRQARDDRASASRSTTSRPSRWSSTTRSAACCAASTARAPRPRSTTTSARRSRRCGSKTSWLVIIKKSPRRSTRWPPPATILVRTLRAASSGKIRAGVTTAELDAAAEQLHPLAGRDAGLQGLPRLPRLDLRVAELDGRARHPRALQARARRRHLRRRRRRPRRLGRRRRAHVPGRPGRRRSPRKLLDVDAGSRSSTPSSSAGAGNRLGDVSHAVQARVEAEGLSRRPLARRPRDRARRCTRTRRSRTTASRAAGLSSRRAWSSPSSRWSPPAATPSRMGDDGWAIYSQDGSLAAHFEFTIAVTADGPRILTPWHEVEPAPDAAVPPDGR